MKVKNFKLFMPVLVLALISSSNYLLLNKNVNHEFILTEEINLENDNSKKLVKRR